MKKLLLLVSVLIAAGMTWAFIWGSVLLLHSSASTAGKVAGSAMFIAMTCFTLVIVVHLFIATSEVPEGATKPAFERSWRKYALYCWVAALACMLAFIALEFVVQQK